MIGERTGDACVSRCREPSGGLIPISKAAVPDALSTAIIVNAAHLITRW